MMMMIIIIIIMVCVCVFCVYTCLQFIFVEGKKFNFLLLLLFSRVNIINANVFQLNTHTERDEKKTNFLGDNRLSFTNTTTMTTMMMMIVIINKFSILYFVHFFLVLFLLLFFLMNFFFKEFCARSLN